MKINKLIIDSSDSITELCQLGIKYPTDKSAYHYEDLHKHSYMPIYDLLFMSMKYKPIRLLEAGILNNMSIKCWREYFVNAQIYGFDYDNILLDKAISDNLHDTFYETMNVRNQESIVNAFENSGGNYDIIIEDTLHNVSDNYNFSKVAYKYLNSGGYLIIEDLCEFENLPFGGNYEQLYNQYFEPIKKYFHSMTFVISQHKNNYSGNLDNSNLLILCRNEILD